MSSTLGSDAGLQGLRLTASPSCSLVESQAKPDERQAIRQHGAPSLLRRDGISARRSAASGALDWTGSEEVIEKPKEEG